MRLPLAALLLAAGLLMSAAPPAAAFAPEPADPGPGLAPGGPPISDPDPITGGEPPEVEPEEAVPGGAADQRALPPPQHDPAQLPEPVRRLRDHLIAAARTGDPQALRRLFPAGEPPVFSSIPGGDPIDILRAQSGDAEGREILAILIDVLEAGWIVADAGTPAERYVWPWFSAWPAEALDGPKMVEVFRVLTAGDFEESVAYGGYVFYRVEIAPDGRWLSFVSGE